MDTDDLDLESLYNEFIEIALSDAGYKGIADCLAQRLQENILIEDEFFHVLARSFLQTSKYSEARNRHKYCKPQFDDPRIKYYVDLSYATSQPVVVPELPEYGIDKARIVFPILLKNSKRVSLHIFKKDLDCYQARVVKAALHSLMVMETCRQRQADMEEKIRRSWILSLISSEQNIAKKYDVEKQILGFDYSQVTVMAVIQIKHGPGLRRMEEVLHSISRDLDLNASATSISHEQAVLLVQATEGNALESTEIMEALQELFEALKKVFSDCQVKIAVGRQCFKSDDYRIAFAEAIKALAISGPAPEQKEGVIYYHSLGLMGVLSQPGNKYTLTAFVRQTLGKLLDFEVSHHNDLIGSVGCYLNHNCNVQSAAKELFIHPNTLKYRLNKVQKISDLDLSDADKKLEFQLAIRIYKYYGESLWEF